MAKSAQEGNAGKGRKYNEVLPLKDTSSGKNIYVGYTDIGTHGLRSPEDDHNRNVNPNFAFSKANKK